MSSLIVDVCAVEEIATHPNADRIERVRVKNWWCIAGKGQYKIGDKVVYVPPDAVISKELAERWGIAKYCVPCGDSLRIKASRFRGVSSFGTVQDPDDMSWEIGKDVREHYGVTKYEPPVKASDGDAAPAHPAFHAYTSIENIGNFPGVFKDGEEVVVSEKIHGTNCRIGFVRTGTTVEHGEEEETWEWMAGSHAIRRKEFNDKGSRSSYWMPLQEQNEDEDEECPPDHLRLLIVNVWLKEDSKHSVIVFGEIFGSKVQDMTYGQTGQSFRIFDIAVDGNYLDYVKMKEYVEPFAEHGLLTVPILYQGPYSLEKMSELVDGPTTICSSDQIKEPFKGREGIVIKPIRERVTDYGSRCVLKYISVDYHERKNQNATEDH